eukprot:766390-Hanusia_phi.AAC.5
MNFRRVPGQDGFKRLVLVTRALAGADPHNLVGGKKETRRVYTEITNNLNEDPLFNGTLKYCTVRDKGLELLKMADKVIAEGEEQYLKTIQLEGRDVNELDHLYIHFARIKSGTARQMEELKTGLATPPGEIPGPPEFVIDAAQMMCEEENQFGAAEFVVHDEAMRKMNPEPPTREERRVQSEVRPHKRARVNADGDAESKCASSDDNAYGDRNGIFELVEPIESSFSEMIRSFGAKAKGKADSEKELHRFQSDHEQKISKMRLQAETLREKIEKQDQYNKMMEQKIEMLKSLLVQEGGTSK